VAGLQVEPITSCHAVSGVPPCVLTLAHDIESG
jgi:hypothetical protein